MTQDIEQRLDRLEEMMAARLEYEQTIAAKIDRLQQIMLRVLPLENADWINDIERRLDDLEKIGPIDPRRMFPPVSEITKLKVQWFVNSNRAVCKNKLKVYVWTCPAHLHGRYIQGTCGSFYMNMADPKHKNFKRHMKGKLDYLDVPDAKLVGAMCISKTNKFDQGKHYDQAAILMPDDRLYLDLYGVRIDCGAMRSAPADREANASIGWWQYPDTY